LLELGDRNPLGGPSGKRDTGEKERDENPPHNRVRPDAHQGTRFLRRLGAKKGYALGRGGAKSWLRRKIEEQLRIPPLRSATGRNDRLLEESKYLSKENCPVTGHFGAMESEIAGNQKWGWIRWFPLRDLARNDSWQRG
jgi:hypothetical protein